MIIDIKNLFKPDVSRHYIGAGIILLNNTLR